MSPRKRIVVRDLIWAHIFKTFGGFEKGRKVKSEKTLSISQPDINLHHNKVILIGYRVNSIIILYSLLVTLFNFIQNKILFPIRDRLNEFL